MRNSVLILAILVMMVSCGGYSEKGAEGHRFISRNGKAYYAGEDKPYTGYMHISSGAYKLNGYYKNGERQGTWKYWFENGQLQRTETYKNGNLHGMRKEWYSDGELKSKEKYDNGSKMLEK